MSRIAINDLEIQSSIELQTLEQEKQFVIKGGIDLWPFDNWRKRRAKDIADCDFEKANRIWDNHN